MNLYIKIKNNNKMSKTMHSISRYILTHPKEVIALNIAELAKVTYVSPATIVRYTQLLGCDGYRDFKLRLASDVNEYLTCQPVKKDDLLSTTPNMEINDVKDYCLNFSTLAINNQYKYIDENSIVLLVDRVIESKKVSIWGIGSSLLAAKDFAYRLRKIGVYADAETLMGYDDTVFKVFNGDELNIIISQSLENIQVLQWMSNFIQDEREFMVITTNKRSPYIEKSENAVFYGNYELNMSMSDPFMNRISLYFVLDIIVGLVYTKQYSISLNAITNYKIAVNKQKKKYEKSREI